MKYTLYAAGEQSVNKQFMQMERHFKDTDIIGCSLKNSAVWDKGCYCQIFWGTEDIEKLHEEGKKLLIPEVSQESLEEQRKAADFYWKAMRELLKAVEKNAGLTEAYDAYAYALRRVYAHFITTTGPVVLAVENKLKEILGNFFGNKADEISRVLTTPTEKDILFEELADWKEVLKNPSKENVLKHTKKYSILLANIFSEQEAMEWANHRMKEKSWQVIEKEIGESQRRKNELKTRQQEIFKKLNSKEAEQLSSFLCQGGVTRLLLKACWNGEAYHLLPFYEKMAEKTGCSVRDVYMFYTWKEISNLLHHGINLSKEELEKRKKYCLLHLSEDKIDIYNGEEALEMKKKILEPSLPSEETTSFSGSIANQGIAVGQVKVLKVDNPIEIQKLTQTLGPHHILVTGMTNPTMVVLIDKVKGIITDEGGITCHAAIISREFGLPCLVGCQIATMVLKDDDYVVLDANKGVVKKISEEEFNKLK